MASLQLHLRLKIQSGQTDITSLDPTIEPINNFLHTMFEQITVTLNEVQITPTSTLYPYRAFIESCLGTNGEYQRTMSRTALFTAEEKVNSITSVGFSFRVDSSKKSAVFDIVGRPFIDICGQSRYLIPNTDVRLTFHKSPTTFCLREHIAPLTAAQATAGTAAAVSRGSYNIHIESARLSLKKIQVIPSILTAHLKLLQAGNMACYPMRRVEVKSFALPKGTVQNVNETLLSGRLPDRIIIAFVKSEQFHGTLQSNPFEFTDFKLSNISITVNGDSNFHKSIDLDADSGFVIEPYYNMFSELSLDPCDEGPSVTLEAYKHGKMFFVFNLNDITGGDSFGVQRHGTIKIETKFKQGLADSTNVICHADYQSTLYIDSSKAVYFKE
jgi:hypothetical protein